MTTKTLPSNDHLEETKRTLKSIEGSLQRVYDDLMADRNNRLRPSELAFTLADYATKIQALQLAVNAIDTVIQTRNELKATENGG